MTLWRVMSEPTRNKTAGQASFDGSSDLRDLHASKDLHTRGQSPVVHNTDLAEVSLSTSHVVRSSERASGFEHQRGTTQGRQLNGRSTSPQTLGTGRRISRSSKAASETQSYGVFKNPKYPYAGDPVSRFITFLANIFKVLEQFILRLFGLGPKKAIQQNQPNPTVANSAARDTGQTQKDKDKPKDDVGISVHRSS